MSGDMVLWTVIIAAGLAGVSLLVIGLRGRQVDDHPICRKCGFDLIGLENASEPACPECGAAILGPASLRTGNRARRGRTASLGLVLLALSVVGAGGITWSIHKGFNWNTVKPAWWLAIDAESSDLIAARGALQELTASLGRGELGKSRQAALVERGLRRQADAARPWLTEWGDVIEGVRATGALSPADRSRYLRGMVDMAVSARPRVRRGDDLAAHAGPVLRCGSGTVLACRAILTDVLLGDTPVGPPGTFVLEALCGPRFGAPSGPMFEHPLVPSDLGMPDESRAFGGRDYRLAADVEPGTHALKTTWVITVGAPKAGAGAGGTTGTSTWAPYSWGRPGPLAWLGIGREGVSQREPDLKERLLRGEAISINSGIGNQLLSPGGESETTSLEHSVMIEVLPPDAETVELVADESMRGALERAVRVAIIHCQCNSNRSRCCEVSFVAPPLDVAFEVFQVTPTGERRLGCVVGRPNSQGVVAEFPVRRARGDDGSVYDIILRPSRDTARKTREVTRIWGDELRFPDVRPAKSSMPEPGSTPDSGP